MAKNKKNKNESKKELKNTKKKSFGSNPFVWIILGVLLVFVIVMLVKKDGKVSSEIMSDELTMKYNSCFSYAQASLRAEFCKYTLVNGDLVNCRDSRIVTRLASEGIDVNLGSLNCRSVDIYSYRKDVCSGYSADTKIADSTCADYR